MHLNTACVALISFIAARAYAAPSVPPTQEPSCSSPKEYTAPSVSTNGESYCPDLYLVEKWGYLMESNYYNASQGFPLRGCTSVNRKRDDGDVSRTVVDVSDDSCHCAEYKDGSSSPQIEIWDMVDQLCTENYCDPSRSVSVLDGDDEGGTLVLTLDGQFANKDIRDNFIGAIKESFLRSALVTEEPDFVPKRPMSLPSAINVQLSVGDDVYGYITMHMVNQSPKLSCPDFLNAFATAGAAFTGPYAPFFGAISTGCLVAAGI